MNTSQDSISDQVSRIQAALQSGQTRTAHDQLLRLLEQQPANLDALAACARTAIALGETAVAIDCLTRHARQSHDPMSWIGAAMQCQRSGDQEREAEFILEALKLDPAHLIALVMRASLAERRGNRHKAAVAHGAVAAVAPPLEQLSSDLRAAVVNSIQQRDRYHAEMGSFLDSRLADSLADASQAGRERFSLALDIMVGRKRRYESESMSFHYPGLLPMEFFPRERFPWLDAFETGTDAIREEFLAVLALEKDFVPYLTYPEGSPVNQFAELNNSPRWSAYHLKQAGKDVAEHAAQCPATMSLLATAPQPDQPGRTPAAMFSLLKPRTRIPAHTGVSNTRLVTHVPLIIPEHCGFRVGNTTRAWVPGKAWVFDDTINHEAWNMSDKLRVILMFDIWHPDLDEGERQLITRMMSGLNEFTGEVTAFEL